jgi:hypothetical protein
VALSEPNGELRQFEGVCICAPNQKKNPSNHNRPVNHCAGPNYYRHAPSMTLNPGAPDLDPGCSGRGNQPRKANTPGGIESSIRYPSRAFKMINCKVIVAVCSRGGITCSDYSTFSYVHFKVRNAGVLIAVIWILTAKTSGLFLIELKIAKFPVPISCGDYRDTGADLLRCGRKC